jgi:hypothetical protein
MVERRRSGPWNTDSFPNMVKGRKRAEVERVERAPGACRGPPLVDSASGGGGKSSRSRCPSPTSPGIGTCDEKVFGDEIGRVPLLLPVSLACKQPSEAPPPAVPAQRAATAPGDDLRRRLSAARTLGLSDGRPTPPALNQKTPSELGVFILAPGAGLEPATIRLTAERSTD